MGKIHNAKREERPGKGAGAITAGSNRPPRRTTEANIEGDSSTRKAAETDACYHGLLSDCSGRSPFHARCVLARFRRRERECALGRASSWVHARGTAGFHSRPHAGELADAHPSCLGQRCGRHPRGVRPLCRHARDLRGRSPLLRDIPRAHRAHLREIPLPRRRGGRTHRRVRLRP